MANILVIAPHPDDEVLGCGGTIKKHVKKGDGVYLCIMTKAYTPEWSGEFIKNRPKEVARAGKILGIKKTFFLDFPTAKLDTIPQKDLNSAIQGVINEVGPEIVFIPHHGDLNKDHRLVHEAALVATRPLAGSYIKKVLVYETLSETEWGIAPRFTPNVYFNISLTIKSKLKAMAVYASELKSRPRSLEVIEALAKKRGSEAGFQFAEAFMLLRELN